MATTNTAENTVTVEIMNRAGHETKVVIYDDVVEITRKEMGEGKWANVLDKGGQNKVYMSFEELEAEILRQRDRLTAVEKIQLITALTGGAR